MRLHLTFPGMGIVYEFIGFGVEIGWWRYFKESSKVFHEDARCINRTIGINFLLCNVSSGFYERNCTLILQICTNPAKFWHKYLSDKPKQFGGLEKK